MTIELSVEFDNFYGINAWYNLTGIRSIYIGEQDSRLGVTLEFEHDVKIIYVNESIFHDKRHRYDVLQDILKHLIDCVQYYGIEDEKDRTLSNSQIPAFASEAGEDLEAI